MNVAYDQFVARKLSTVPPTGLAGFSIASGLFDHQSALTEWALRRGRAAIFVDTGLGKSRMQLAWADAVHRHAGHDVLILAPLAVAAQTVHGRVIDPMTWADKMARQPGGDGPRELELSADFICAMAGPSVFEPLRAAPTVPRPTQATGHSKAKGRGRR